MTRPKSSRRHHIITKLLLFAAIFALVFFGIQFITKTGIFRIPGVVYYDESLNTSEIELLNTIFTEEIVLDKNVTISASESNQKPELTEGEYLYAIVVPTADFYDTRNDTTEFDDNEYKLMPIEQLDFSKKLLSMDNQYYLDSFDSGAIFRIVKFESEKFAEEIEPLVDSTFTKTFPEKSTVLSLVQTGVTAMSRGMNRKLNSIGGNATYFSSQIRDFLSSFDLTHTSNEASFTDFASNDNICSDKRFVNTLLDIGLDIVELTGNHNQDCGDQAAIESIDTYVTNNIKTVGGGKTATDAAVPLEISEKGNNITMLAYNQSTGGATYDNTPGANQYYEERVIQDIAVAKDRGDFIIIDIQYYECSAYASEYEDATCDYANSAAGDQIGFFRHLIDLGADMVVGTSAHQPQTFELYGDGVIYYGLGNLLFDQVWWPGTTRSLALGNYFYQGKLLQTKITPTVYDADMQTKVMDKETAKWFLNRLIGAKP